MKPRATPNQVPPALRRQSQSDLLDEVQSVVGTFATLQRAEHATEQFAKSSFPLEQLSVVAKSLESERQVHGLVTSGKVAADTGVWLGGCSSC